MRRLIFRTAASSDMRSIARYTRKRWGDDQAAAYVAILRDDIKSLREFPVRFPDFGGKYIGLRQMGSGRYIVFYLVADEAIEVVRVLHQAMDFSERL